MRPDNITVPVTCDRFYDFLDIPKFFYEMTCYSPKFDKFIDDVTVINRITEVTNFNVIMSFLNMNYIVFLLDMYNNYLLYHTNSNILSTNSGKSSIIHGLLAVHLLLWDYDPLDIEGSIERGKEQLENYYQDKFYQQYGEKVSFVKLWINQKIRKNKLIQMLKALNENCPQFSTRNLTKTDIEVVKILRDAKIYGPFVFLNSLYVVHSYHDRSMMDYVIENFIRYISSMIIYTNFIRYRISNYDELYEHILNYFTQESTQKPLSDHTKRSIGDNIIDFIKNLHDQKWSKYFDTFEHTDEIKFMKDVFEDERYKDILPSIWTEKKII